MRRISCFVISGLLLCLAAEKKPSEMQAGNDQLQITATLYADKDAVRQQLGSDLDGYFIVVKVDLAPKAGKTLAVSRDDFLLRSYKDGQKSQPFEPSQIAGTKALVISSVAGGGGIVAENPGPAWGGIGGRPGRLGSPDQGQMGNTASETQAQATLQSTGKDKDKEDPLLAVLAQKILPEKEIQAPLSGLLYFSLEGKHKPKDLMLQYNGPAGKLNLQFR